MAEQTGAPVPHAVVVDRRHQAVRTERDVNRRRIALAVIGVMLLAIASIVIAGYVLIFVLPSREVVVRVNDVTYTRGDMVKLLRVSQKGIEYLGGKFNATNDIFQTLQLFVENEIISQSAPSLGISVTDDEIKSQIRGIFTRGAAASGTMDPGQVEREFQERYKGYLNAIQYSELEYNQLTRRSIVREKTRQFIGESVPTFAEQVRVQQIIVSPTDEVDIMQVKLEDALRDATEPEEIRGAVEGIVREFSRDSREMIRLGGDLGWLPRGILKDHEYAFFDLEVGKLSEVSTSVQDQQTLYYFIVSERAEARELDPEDLEARKTAALQTWINGQRAKFDVYSDFNSEIYEWMLEQLGLSAAPQEEEEQQPLGPFGF